MDHLENRFALTNRYRCTTWNAYLHYRLRWVNNKVRKLINKKTIYDLQCTNQWTKPTSVHKHKIKEIFEFIKSSGSDPAGISPLKKTYLIQTLLKSQLLHSVFTTKSLNHIQDKGPTPKTKMQEICMEMIVIFASRH